MFIVWGKKVVHQRLGYVADFCPICRTQRPFELQRVGVARHIYYISSGQGELAGYERTCKECGTLYSAEPTLYASVSKRLLPLPALTKQTFPNMSEVLRDRLAFEEKIQRTPSLLTQEERYAFIRSPFLLLSPQVEKQLVSKHLDKEIGLSIAAALGLVFLAPALAQDVAPDSVEIALVTSIVFGTVLVIWQLLASGRRYVKRRVAPLLATCLRPLNPTEGELNAVLIELKQLRHKIATKLKPADLLPHLKERSPRPPRQMP